MKKYSMFLLLFIVFIAGCTSTAKLNAIQTSSVYPNKLNLSALVYIPPEFKNRIIQCSSSTSVCALSKAKIDAGNGYYTT